MDSYLIAGLAVRFPSPLDWEARQIAEVVPAADETDALSIAAERLAVEAPIADGWQGHAIRATPLRPMEVAA